MTREPTTRPEPSTSDHPHRLADLPPSGRAAVRAGVIGNYVDQLHIFLPVTALAPAMATIAGPHASPTTAALVVMATLLGRPAGAMVFGRIADRLGRTRTTRIAIAGTALATLGIAAVPTHHVIGVWAIGLVIALRFIGGVFLAGEYSAAIPLSMEWSAPRRRGLVSGLIMSMAPWAQASIAFAVVGLLAWLGPTDYATWGWRLPFVAGGCASLLVLGYYVVRVRDAQAPASRARSVGFADLLIGRFRRGFWQMFGLMTGLWFLTNLTVIVLTARLGTDLGFDARAVSVAMGVAAIGQAVVMALAGAVSTRTGRRRFFVGWGVLAAVSAPALWLFIMAQDTLAPAAAGAALLQVCTVCAYGPIGAYLSERFPAELRSTGYGTAYSLSIIVPALYPYYLPVLGSLLGRNGAVLALLVLGGLLVAVCGRLGPRLAPADIDHPLEEVARRG